MLDWWLVGAGKRIDKIPSVITDALVAGSERVLLHHRVNIRIPRQRGGNTDLVLHWCTLI